MKKYVGQPVVAGARCGTLCHDSMRNEVAVTIQRLGVRDRQRCSGHIGWVSWIAAVMQRIKLIHTSPQARIVDQNHFVSV